MVLIQHISQPTYLEALFLKMAQQQLGAMQVVPWAQKVAGIHHAVHVGVGYCVAKPCYVRLCAGVAARVTNIFI